MKLEPDAVKLVLAEQALQRGQVLAAHVGDGGIDAAVPPLRFQGARRRR